MPEELLDNQQAEQEANDVAVRYMDSSDVLSDMQRDYGGVLGSVRIHDDSAAEQRLDSVERDGLATGRDVYMRPGLVNSGRPEANGLLAHELSHVVQQGSGSVEYGSEQGGLLEWFKGLKDKITGKKDPEDEILEQEMLPLNELDDDEREEQEDKKKTGKKGGKPEKLLDDEGDDDDDDDISIDDSNGINGTMMEDEIDADLLNPDHDEEFGLRDPLVQRQEDAASAPGLPTRILNWFREKFKRNTQPRDEQQEEEMTVEQPLLQQREELDDEEEGIPLNDMGNPEDLVQQQQPAAPGKMAAILGWFRNLFKKGGGGANVPEIPRDDEVPVVHDDEHDDEQHHEQDDEQHHDQQQEAYIFEGAQRPEFIRDADENEIGTQEAAAKAEAVDVRMLYNAAMNPRPGSAYARTNSKDLREKLAAIDAKNKGNYGGINSPGVEGVDLSGIMINRIGGMLAGALGDGFSDDQLAGFYKELNEVSNMTVPEDVEVPPEVPEFVPDPEKNRVQNYRAKRARNKKAREREELIEKKAKRDEALTGKQQRFDKCMLKLKELYFVSLKRMEATYGTLLTQMHPQDILNQLAEPAKFFQRFLILQDTVRFMNGAGKYFDFDNNEEDKQFKKLSDYFSRVGKTMELYINHAYRMDRETKEMLTMEGNTRDLLNKTADPEKYRAMFGGGDSSEEGIGGPHLDEEQMTAYKQELAARSKNQKWGAALYGPFAGEDQGRYVPNPGEGAFAGQTLDPSKSGRINPDRNIVQWIQETAADGGEKRAGMDDLMAQIREQYGELDFDLINASYSQYKKKKKEAEEKHEKFEIPEPEDKLEIEGFNLKTLIETLMYEQGEGLTNEEIIELISDLTKGQLDPQTVYKDEEIKDRDISFNEGMNKLKGVLLGRMKKIEATYGTLPSQMHPDDFLKQLPSWGRFEQNAVIVRDARKMMEGAKRYFNFEKNPQDQELKALTDYYFLMFTYYEQYVNEGISEAGENGARVERVNHNVLAGSVNDTHKRFSANESGVQKGPSMTKEQKERYLRGLRRRATKNEWKERLFGIYENGIK